MSTRTKIEEAVEAFRKAGGILTMSELSKAFSIH